MGKDKIEIDVYEEGQPTGDISDDRSEESVDAEDYEKLKDSPILG